MDVFIHGSAQKFLDKIEKKTQAAIKEQLKKLAENPYSTQPDIKKLKGLKNKPDLFRLRIGEYRVIYFVEENSILITEIMARKKGYDF
jgi:mRNA interferase RelE/StbE